jgi:hypothetical protein
MRKDQEAKTARRRDFLKLASLGGVSGAAAAVLGSETADANVEEGRAGGYRETDHVKKVYDLARF